MAGSFMVTGVDGPGGLKSLEAELARAAAIAPAEVLKVVQKGSSNIKRDWQSRWSNIPHLPTITYTITYDTYVKGSQIGADIGADKAKQVGGGPHRTPGNLASVLEFGTVNNAPIPGGAPALESERPRFEQALDALPLDLLGKSWR